MKKIILIWLLVLGMGFVSSAGQSLVFDYSNESVSADVNYPSFVLRINTDFEANCRYKVGSAGSLEYSDMTFFSTTGNTIHKEQFLDQSDKIVDVHVKCWDKISPHSEIGDFKITLNINSLIDATLALSKEDPINAGKLGIDLRASKLVSGVPVLEYSLDAKTYSPIALTGSGKDWSGYLFVEENFGEGVLSFRFRAKDLEGREGSMIVSKNVFVIDTIPPGVVEKIEIDTDSDEDEIELEWEEVEGAAKYNVYRSTTSEVDKGDYLQSVDEAKFVDLEAEEGEVYYYKVSCVDAAGNEGELSEVVYAKLDGVSSGAGQEEDKDLDPLLIPKVDSILRDMDYLKTQLASAKTDINSLEEDVQEFVGVLDLQKEITSLKSDIDSIESSAENLKTQDMTEESLNSKLDQLYVRLRAIEKRIPVDVSLIDSKDVEEGLDEKTILDALKNDDPFLSEGEYQKALRDIQKLIDEKDLRISSKFTHIQVSYNGGEKDDYVFVKRRYDSIFEKMEGVYFVEIFPESLFDALESARVVNSIYDLKLDKNAIYFPTDTKVVNYYFEEDIFSKVGSISPSVVYVVPVEGSVGGGITGFSIFSSGSVDLTFAIVLVVFLVLLGAYLFLRFRRKKDVLPKEVRNKLIIMGRLVDGGLASEAKTQYSELQKYYGSLTPKQKMVVFREVREMQTRLLVREFEKDLLAYKENKNPVLLQKMEKVYESFPNKYKKKLKDSFLAIKK